MYTPILPDIPILMDVMTNEYWPMYCYALHVTCKQLYYIWHEKGRAATMVHRLTAHTAAKLARGESSQTLYWGPICLHKTQNSGEVCTDYTSCGRPNYHWSINGCCDIACKTFSVQISHRRAYNAMCTDITKYDSVNGIHYSILFLTTDPQSAMAKLYDCPRGQPRDMHLIIDVDDRTQHTLLNEECTSRWPNACPIHSNSYSICSGDITTVDMKHVVRSDVPSCNVVDGVYLDLTDVTYIQCRLADVKNNLGALFMYMRSQTVDSSEYMPKLVSRAVKCAR